MIKTKLSGLFHQMQNAHFVEVISLLRSLLVEI